MDIYQFRVLLPNYTIDKDEFLDRFLIGIYDCITYYELKTIEDNINEIKNIHDNRHIIYEFLELNKFYYHGKKENYFITEYGFGHLSITIMLYSCDIVIYKNKGPKISKYKCTMDEFFIKMRELLDIDSQNKPIFE